MQIEIDFDVFKALTSFRSSESDSYNDVLRRLLNLSESDGTSPDIEDALRPAYRNALALALNAEDRDGAWIGNVYFPNGTRLRATYKGETFRAEIRGNRWIDQDGKVRGSPSEAASAISGTQVNGWRFWFGIRPGDDDWKRLDEFRK